MAWNGWNQLDQHRNINFVQFNCISQPANHLGIYCSSSDADILSSKSNQYAKEHSREQHHRGSSGRSSSSIGSSGGGGASSQ